jgi:hypothetical protein
MEEEQKEISELVEEKEDPFRRFMFGPRRRPAERDASNSRSDKAEDEIDYMLLMENIDALIDTAKQLKPLFNKITPFINQFIKK